MQKLSAAATVAYYETTRTTYWLGLISWEQVLERLAFLHEEVDDLSLKKKLLFLVGEAIEERPAHEEDDNQGLSVELISAAEGSNALRPFEEPETLQLIIKKVSGLSRWFFVQGDPDYFPSIPHGRERGHRRKLDAYLGWIYLSSDQIGRESRRLIVALWNDEQFRHFARDSITWYVATYPYFRWRVPFPTRLPRKRK